MHSFQVFLAAKAIIQSGKYRLIPMLFWLITHRSTGFFESPSTFVGILITVKTTICWNSILLFRKKSSVNDGKWLRGKLVHKEKEQDESTTLHSRKLREEEKPRTVYYFWSLIDILFDMMFHRPFLFRFTEWKCQNLTSSRAKIDRFWEENVEILTRSDSKKGLKFN